MKTMKQRDQESSYPKSENVYNSNVVNNLSGRYFEFNSYRQIENDGGYHYEFEEEYENYNSDYDLNIK